MINQTSDGSTLTLTVGRFEFVVEDGVVNNLGVLSWVADKINNKHGFWGGGQPDSVQDRLTTLFPETRWAELDWKPVSIKY